MVYIVGLGIVYGCLLIQSFARYRGKVFILICLLLLAYIAITRGEVGTDTVTYEQIAGLFRSGLGFKGLEPGFAALIQALDALVASDQIVVRAVSALFVCGLLLFLVKADRNEAFFLISFYIPALFYAFSMNTLRLGLASVFLLLFVQYKRRELWKSSATSGLVSILFHYSSIASVAYISAMLYSWKSWKGALVFVVLALTAIALLYFGESYFDYKMYLYDSANYQMISAFSGLSQVIVIVVLLTGVMFSNINYSDRLKIMLTGFVLCIASYAIVFFSYAGLRFLNLLVLDIPIAITAICGRDKLQFSASIRVSYLIAGVIAAAAAYRGYVLYYGVGPSPFLPYALL